MDRRQAVLLRRFFKENAYLSQFLLAGNYQGLLDQNLKAFYPLTEEIFEDLHYQMCFLEPTPHSPVDNLLAIEEHSPLLLNRDLASVALARLGRLSGKRADLLCGLMLYTDEDSPVALEAALSFSFWKNWDQPLSKWWDWTVFIDVVNQGFSQPDYEAWSACAYLWAYQRQSQEFNPLDSGFRSLVEDFSSLLYQGLTQNENEALFKTCLYALKGSEKKTFHNNHRFESQKLVLSLLP